MILTCMLLLAVLRGGAGAPQEDLGTSVTMQLLVPADQFFVQQQIPVRLRVQLPTQVVEDHLVQLFTQQLDLPLEIRVPWLQSMEGLLVDQEPPAVEAAPPGPGPLRLVFNDRVVITEPLEEQGAEGVALTVLEIPLLVRAMRAGPLSLAGAQLRYAYATGFTVDFFGDRVPENRTEAEVAPPDLVLEILPLPAEHRPEGFTGAVGVWSVQARADVEGVAVGESFSLHLRVEGQGNLFDFEAPSLPGMDGLTVRGMLDQRGEGWREFVYEVVREDLETPGVPPIPFTWFDPRTPPSYRTLHTEPIAFPDARPPHTSPGTAPEENSDADDSDPPKRIPPALLILGIVAPFALGFLIFQGAGRKKAPGPSPGPTAAPEAADAARRALESRPGKEEEVLTTYLATQLQVGPAAVIGPDLAERLQQAGVAATLAQQVSQLLVALTAVRYGGAEVTDANRRCREVVEALEAQSWAAPPPELTR